MNRNPGLNRKTKTPADIVRYGSMLLVLILAVPLVAYAYMGTFMRYSGDDYCYAWILRQNGFWNAQVVSYLQVSMYNGNRYSLTLFSGLGDLIGPIASGLLPGLAVLLMVMGLALVLRKIMLWGGISTDWLPGILGAEFLSLMTLIQAPDLYQILYWRTAMLTYLAPVIANTYLLALIFWHRESRNPSWIIGVLVFILAVLAGGFSETGFALQLTFLAMAAGALVFIRRNQPGTRWSIWVCCAALCGTVLAGILLAVSPTNQARLTDLPTRPDLFNLIISVLGNIRIFSVVTLKSLFLFILINFLFPLGLGMLLYGSQPDHKTKLVTVLVKMGLVVILGFLLLCACFMPSAYIQSSYPGLRALIAARFVMVLIIAATGWLAGQAIVVLFRSVMVAPRLQVLIFLSIFTLGAFTVIRTVPTILSEQSKFQRWVVLWDQRDREIRTASLHNVDKIEVVQLDHIIPDVGELAPDPAYWYNQCAAGYYEIDSIIANQPGWDQ